MVFGASFDTPEDNKAFADAENFDFRLLSDTGRAVGRRYEVERQPGEQYADYPMRIAYLIDPEGTIRGAFEVSDVEGFAAKVLADVEELRS